MLRFCTIFSDTESADVRPKDNKRTLPPIKLTSFFKKNKDKPEEDPEERLPRGDEDKSPLADSEAPKAVEAKVEIEKKGEKGSKEGLVYAELDLVSPNAQNLKPVVKNDDEKTEYAEIVYTPNEGQDNSDETKEKKEGKK